MFRFFTCYLLKFVDTFIVIVFQGPHVSVVGYRLVVCFHMIISGYQLLSSVVENGDWCGNYQFTRMLFVVDIFWRWLLVGLLAIVTKSFLMVIWVGMMTLSMWLLIMFTYDDVRLLMFRIFTYDDFIDMVIND